MVSFTGWGQVCIPAWMYARTLPAVGRRGVVGAPRGAEVGDRGDATRWHVDPTSRRVRTDRHGDLWRGHPHGADCRACKTGHAFQVDDRLGIVGTAIEPRPDHDLAKGPAATGDRQPDDGRDGPIAGR